LQSVERESRKLEAEEREAKRREALDTLIREATRDPAPSATGATPPAARTPAMTQSNPAASNAGASGARPPATGLFAPELPAPQLIPANPHPAVTVVTPSLPAAPAIESVAPNPGALPLNPPLPQRRPTANAQGPVELAPPARRGSRIEQAPLFSPQ